ncbi:helix-turn-helix domain-containing protein [Maribellus sp. CM-23]|uniref:helix-turn-helix domain-containing protein n=1 Tax=Maribellus sp. CM-23 TaxID=2781026 RepID=UPI001F40143B|nr:helix-turn-helix domain-containing protein [Maribellus sp. CM-23]MCE4563466.1 helix-turn-helix domain-containing protein [Maribellus sp. CM-23]
MSQIILQGISLDEFKELLAETVESRFKVQEVHSKVQSNQNYLSRLEVAKLLKISLPTLNEWTKIGHLQSYRIGNRVLYKAEEVDKSLSKVMNLKHRRA